jgi:glycerol kinase
MRVLAIDQGTTSTRSLLFEDEAPPRVVASMRHRQFFPRSGWVEQDPAEILANVLSCIDAAGPLDTIGLANQGESCLAWDAVTGQPLSPIIVWQDNRTADRIEQLRAEGHETWVRERTGLPLDAYFSASKFGWIMREIPAAAEALSAGRLRLGTTDAYLLERITGTFATDTSTASRTALMNLGERTWDPELCALFGVPMEALPPIRSSTAGFGYYRDAHLAVSMVDQQAALYGHGARRPGDAKITFGTGAFALAHAGSTPPSASADGLIATVAWSTGDESCYALEGGVYDAGAAIEWARRLGIAGDSASLAALPPPPVIDQGLLFVPALSGLACPHWRRDVGASWMGMTTATTSSDLVRAVLEGIALQTADVVDAFDRRIGLGDTIAVDGGVASNDLFLQFLADASGRKIRRAGSSEMTAYGCAILAGHSGSSLPSGRVFMPEASEARRLHWRERYRDAVTRILS